MRSIVVATLACLAAVAAWAATPDELIAARQAGYKHIGDISKAMKEAVADGSDPKPYASQAREIADWGRKIPTLFPPGTEKGHDTEARPEIWSDRDGFNAASAKLPPAAEKVAAAAESGDREAFAAAFKEMANTCGACHRSYKYR